MFLAPVGEAIAGFTKDFGKFSNDFSPIISAGSQIAGGFQQASGADQVYGGAANAMNYNQQVFEQNAKLIEAAAASNKAVGERKKRSYLSTLKATYGSRGINLNGSPLLLMAESASALELDIQNEEFNSLIEANRARSQAAIYGVEADNYRTTASKTKRNIGISSAFKIASQY